MAKKVNNFSGNVPTWLTIADLRIDYYTQFIKSWIPFNAWYTVSYHSDTLDTDRKIIDEIKNKPNPFRDRIINLLEGEDAIAKQFRFFLAQLHTEMEAHSVPNYENRLTFSAINIARNPVNQQTLTHRNLSYKVTYNLSAPKGTKRIKCEILDNKRGFNAIYWDEFFEWSMEELLNSPKYTALAPERKEQLRLCFEDVNPKKPVNIIIKPTRGKNDDYQKPARCVIIDAASHIYFIEDLTTVSKVIIELLYMLRCILFHGELNPTETNQKIYEHAYNIQRILIQELK